MPVRGAGQQQLAQPARSIGERFGAGPREQESGRRVAGGRERARLCFMVRFDISTRAAEEDCAQAPASWAARRLRRAGRRAGSDEWWRAAARVERDLEGLSKEAVVRWFCDFVRGGAHAQAGKLPRSSRERAPTPDLSRGR